MSGVLCGYVNFLIMPQETPGGPREAQRRPRTLREAPGKPQEDRDDVERLICQTVLQIRPIALESQCKFEAHVTIAWQGHRK